MLAPQTEVAGYVVEALIGEGGMSMVYRVRAKDSGGRFALKVLAIRNTEARTRFTREAEIQRALVHPNIVRGIALVDVFGDLGLVMELVDGEPLHSWVLTHRLAPMVSKDTIARQVIQAVGFAHAQGLIHRDLKPGNILVGHSRELQAKVTDFGLAKVLDGLTHTRTGIALGTPRYMAPEQIQDAKRVDARADIWSLGVVLYELYTGQPAFHRERLVDVFGAVAAGDVVDPQVFGVPPRVREAVIGALQVDPNERFQDCARLLEVLDGEESLAHGVIESTVPAPAVSARKPSDSALGREPSPTLLPVSSSEWPPKKARPKPRWRFPMAPWIAGWLGALALVVALLVAVLAVGGTVFALQDAPQTVAPQKPETPMPPPPSKGKGRRRP